MESHGVPYNMIYDAIVSFSGFLACPKSVVWLYNTTSGANTYCFTVYKLYRFRILIIHLCLKVLPFIENCQSYATIFLQKTCFTYCIDPRLKIVCCEYQVWPLFDLCRHITGWNIISYIWIAFTSADYKIHVYQDKLSNPLPAVVDNWRRTTIP